MTVLLPVWCVHLWVSTGKQMLCVICTVSCVFRVIREVFPCFIRAPSDSNAKPIEQLYTGLNSILCSDLVENVLFTVFSPPLCQIRRALQGHPARARAVNQPEQRDPGVVGGRPISSQLSASWRWSFAEQQESGGPSAVCVQ